MPETDGGVVPALDVDSVDALKHLVELTTDVDGIVAYKLGIAGALRLGLPGAVRAIREISDLPIIYDHQKAGPDIPDMARRFSAVCHEAGVNSLILFPLGGPGAVREFVCQARQVGLAPIVGGALPFPEYSASGGGYVADDALERILAAALGHGAIDFVLPAHDHALVGRHSRFLREHIDRPGLFLPGIGPLGGSIPEAFAAAPGCRRYAVVGRAITAADDPREAARRLGGQALTAATTD
ncbi:orotidine 5'-phosphate decarboxylase / HUMPS family protein [Mycobacterium sp. MUNTM1]